MKLYITKYALSEGIIEAESINFRITPDGYYGKLRQERGYMDMNFYLRKDITESLEDAKIIAESMRLKKILSLKKQIEKLESKIL